MEKKGLLIVEDNREILELLTRFLRLTFDRPVVPVQDAMQALAVLSTKTIDVMLVDYKLPDADGLTLAVSARKIYPMLGVVIMTSYLTPELLLEFQASPDVDFYVPKPFRLNDLEVIIGQLLHDNANPQPSGSGS